MTNRYPGTYLIEFSKIGHSRPIPDLTLTAADDDEFCRAVAEHAIPYLKPALEALGRPELVNCFFRTTNEDPTYGDFMWLDLAASRGAHFCPSRITRVADPAPAHGATGPA